MCPYCGDHILTAEKHRASIPQGLTQWPCGQHSAEGLERPHWLTFVLPDPAAEPGMGSDDCHTLGHRPVRSGQYQLPAGYVTLGDPLL